MELTTLIKHPERFDKETLYDLRSLLALHPYYQPARLLLLKNLYLLHDASFDEELRRAAIYLTDRSKLFELVEAGHYQLAPATKEKAAVSEKRQEQPAADRYYDNLKPVIAYIRQHLVEKTGRREYASLPVVCGTFAKDSRQGSPLVVEALQRLAREDSHFHVVDASDLPLLSDRLHFNAQGAQTLGQRVYDIMMEKKIIR